MTIAARTALRIRNGVPRSEGERLYEQDTVTCRLAYDKRYGRYVWPYEREDASLS